jgi:hypothetical protein
VLVLGLVRVVVTLTITRDERSGWFEEKKEKEEKKRKADSHQA